MAIECEFFQSQEFAILDYDIPASENPAATLKRARINNLRVVAEVGKMILAKYLDEDDSRQFQNMIAHCKKVGVINDKTLAAIGRVKQPTANRWINGQNVPTAASRETVIGKLIGLAEQRADNLERGLPEESGLSF